jgi:Mg-chelatase subunit ChlI
MPASQNDFFEKREINGINMYIIPSGTTLYRGDSNFTDIEHPNLLKGDYKFLTPDPKYADKYGIVFEFKTNKELQLVALDDISKEFFVDAPEDIQDILEDNYGYTSHIRDSVEEKDKKISQYICDQGYQGYAANTMESKGFDDDLDAEIIICNAEQYLDRIKRVTEENRIQSKQDELKMRKSERERVGPSKKPRIDRPKPPSMGSLFGDDDDDEDDFQPSRRLFGGKTKKAKKSKKQSKKKKSKTQKKRKSRKSKTNKK